jgi:hypothetical protein
MTSTPATRPSGPVDDFSVAVDTGDPATAGSEASSEDPSEAVSDAAAVVVAGEALADTDTAGEGAGVVDAVIAAGLEVAVLERLDEPAPVVAMGVEEADRVGVRVGVGVGVDVGSATIGAHSDRG